MIFHGIIAITVLITSAMAGVLPAKRVEVPQPNPIPVVLSGIYDFRVTRFETQAVVLSDQTYMTFHVVVYPHAAPVHCFALGTTLTHSLTSYPQTWCHHGHDDEGKDDSFPSSVTNSTDHVWFSWTLGADVDATAPGADGIFGMDRTTGAYLKIVRQVDAHTRDESVVHIPEPYFVVVGEGQFAHQVYNGRENFTTVAVRYTEVQH